jgi:aspartate aminotransferase
VVEAITPRTRGIVINSPCNPTGALISEDDMALVAQAARERDIWIVLDLCYERLIYEHVAHNLPGRLAAELRDRTVLTGSASKTYSMTGWRCGWVLAPAPVIDACGALQSHSTSNVCSITQKATIAALEGPQACVQTMLDEYRTRRDALHAWLTADPRLRCVKPGGAFYLFVDVSDLLSPDRLRTTAELAQALLDREQVAVTPGEAFDAPGFIRISYATSLDRLKEGTRRILRFAASVAPTAPTAAGRASAQG